jgi:hypothetical protein
MEDGLIDDQDSRISGVKDLSQIPYNYRTIIASSPFRGGVRWGLY